MAAPRKKTGSATSSPLPPFLEEFLAGLEAQALAGEDLDRVKILQGVEQAHGMLIDLDAELRDHPEAQERFDRVWRRVTMKLEDETINRARNGKASATTLLRGMGLSTPAAAARSSRLQLEREHRARIGKHRSGW